MMECASPEGEGISFSHSLSPMTYHQWSVNEEIERTPVNVLTLPRRRGKRPCELSATIFLLNLKLVSLSKSFNIYIG